MCAGAGAGGSSFSLMYVHTYISRCMFRCSTKLLHTCIYVCAHICMCAYVEEVEPSVARAASAPGVEAADPRFEHRSTLDFHGTVACVCVVVWVLQYGVF